MSYQAITHTLSRKTLIIFSYFTFHTFAAAAPQLEVEGFQVAILSSGDSITFADAMVGGVSDVLQVNEPGESVTVSFQNVPPGLYQVERA